MRVFPILMKVCIVAGFILLMIFAFVIMLDSAWRSSIATPLFVIPGFALMGLGILGLVLYGRKKS